ncbi:MAG: hypothetical protein ACP5O1_04010, partial [Phycisphaerae bacterium]
RPGTQPHIDICSYHAVRKTLQRKRLEKYGKPGTHKLAPKIPPSNEFFHLDFKPKHWKLAYFFNFRFNSPVGDLGVALGVAHFGYKSATLEITGCTGHLRWHVSAEMIERNRYHFHFNSSADGGLGLLADPVHNAGYMLQHYYGFKPFYQQSVWRESFGGSVTPVSATTNG